MPSRAVVRSRSGLPWTPSRILARGGFALLVVAALVYLLFPFYYAIVVSLRSGKDIFRVSYWPSTLDLDNYVRVFREQPFGHNILSSLIVATTVVVISLLLGVIAAFALGRVRFRGRNGLLLTILGVSMFPQVAVLSGLFELIRALRLYDNLASLVLSYLIFTLPFTTWTLTVFMRDVPRDLEEAAIMDGATPWQLVRHVFLPLLQPALAATGVLAFIAAWNEFLFALTFTLSNEHRTVPVAIALITGASEFELPWGNIMAASVIVTIPLIILVIALQRRLVAGLAAGAIKG
jgi:trehalose/maltose transport system permease protein